MPRGIANHPARKQLGRWIFRLPRGRLSQLRSSFMHQEFSLCIKKRGLNHGKRRTEQNLLLKWAPEGGFTFAQHDDELDVAQIDKS